MKKMPPLGTVREIIHFLFEDIDTLPGRMVDIVVVVLIFVVSALFVVRTYPLDPVTREMIDMAESVIMVLFVIEYLLRIWSAPERLKEMLKIYSLVDLVAIIPVFFAIDHYQVLRVFRALRVLRLVRFLRGTHFFYHRFTYAHVIIIRIVFVVCAIIFVSGGMIFFAENGEPGSRIATFADAVYFSIITLTTVGFGDITPVTGYGRFVTVLMVISGIIFIPYQVRELIRYAVTPEEKLPLLCPGCQHAWHDSDARFCKRCGTPVAAGACTGGDHDEELPGGDDT